MPKKGIADRGDLSGGKNNGFAAVEHDTTLDMPEHGTGKNTPLDIASLAHQIIRRVAMADPLDILFDDRPFIEIRCHIMGCGPDQFYAAPMGLVIGFGALETGKK